MEASLAVKCGGWITQKPSNHFHIKWSRVSLNISRPEYSLGQSTLTFIHYRRIERRPQFELLLVFHSWLYPTQYHCNRFRIGERANFRLNAISNNTMSFSKANCGTIHSSLVPSHRYDEFSPGGPSGEYSGASCCSFLPPGE